MLKTSYIRTGGVEFALFRCWKAVHSRQTAIGWNAQGFKLYIQPAPEGPCHDCEMSLKDPTAANLLLAARNHHKKSEKLMSNGVELRQLLNGSCGLKSDLQKSSKIKTR